MADYKKAILASAVAATMVLGATGQAVAAEEAAGDSPMGAAPVGARSETALTTTAPTPMPVYGEFSYDQQTLTPNSVIRSTFRGATATLCGATTDLVVDNPLGWKISVTGDVEQAFSLPVDELASEDSVRQVMTCTCGGNPADGRASITAEVKGIPVPYLLERAETLPGANTLTFVSSDGTEVSMPLGYVVGRHAVISYQVNGEDLSASVGGNNQLWMTRTPANYFVRDVVEIRVSTEAQPPANPGEGMEYPNSPNVGILAASIR